METEKDNKLAFLDTAVLREPDGRLTTSVYRKPTHTDQYLAYDSHHPQSVKRGIVKCLYERAKLLVTKSSVISEEKRPETEEQCRTRQRVQSYCGFTLCQRSVRRASPLPTTTRRARCFQVRDVVDPAKQDGVVCRIPCECGKVYIGETRRPNWKN